MRPTAVLAIAATALGYLTPLVFLLAQANGWWSMPDLAPFELATGLGEGRGPSTIMMLSVVGAAICMAGLWLESRAQRLKRPAARADFANFGVALVAIGLAVPALAFLFALSVSS